jgi:hypothetical protein
LNSIPLCISRATPARLACVHQGEDRVSSLEYLYVTNLELASMSIVAD